MSRLRIVCGILSLTLLSSALPWAARAADLSSATLVEKGALTYGVAATFAPFEFQKEGTLTGFDIDMIGLLAKKLGFAEPMFKNIKVENNLPSSEDLLREINRGGWSTGYCGQSPERLQAHMANQKDFDLVTLRAPGWRLWPAPIGPI